MGQSAITGINLGVPAYQANFTDANLVAGVLTVTHNLNSQYVSVVVYNNSNQIIIPDEVTATSTSVSTIDLTSYGTLTGTWRAVIIDKGATAYIDPVATDLNLSGQAAEDMAIFDGANWVAKGGTEKIKGIEFTRDTSTATGTQAITGLGFKPSALSIVSYQEGTDEASWGFDDGTFRKCLSMASTGVFEGNGANSIYDNEGGGNAYTGYVQSFDSDGFTISWTRTGTPTGNYISRCLAYR